MRGGKMWPFLVPACGHDRGSLPARGAARQPQSVHREKHVRRCWCRQPGDRPARERGGRSARARNLRARGVRGPITTLRGACTQHEPRSRGVGDGGGVRNLDGVVNMRVSVLQGMGCWRGVHGQPGAQLAGSHPLPATV